MFCGLRVRFLSLALFGLVGFEGLQHQAGGAFHYPGGRLVGGLGQGDVLKVAGRLAEGFYSRLCRVADF